MCSLFEESGDVEDFWAWLWQGSEFCLSRSARPTTVRSPTAPALCMGGPSRVRDEAAAEVAHAGLLRERSAMILGMNPHALREPRLWLAYLWPQKRHWALVLQPLGRPFDAHIVDDFAYNASQCFSERIPSSKFFLVYELMLDQGGMYLMLSMKPDFDRSRKDVCFLGLVGPARLAQISACAEAVVRRYRSYSLIGCNCQHFATDFAASLGASCRVVPEDEAIAQAAAESAIVVGAGGVAIASVAAAGAAGTSAASTALSGGAVAVGAAPYVLTAAAATSLLIGVVGGAALVGIATGYRTIYDNLREPTEAPPEPGAAVRASSAPAEGRARRSCRHSSDPEA